MDKEIRSLPVELTDDEVRDRAKRLSQKLEERNDIEAELKDYSATQKERMKELDKDTRRLARVVHSGHENREVECFWAPDHERQVMVLWRLDLGTAVDSRPMTMSERQRNLFPIDGGRAAGAEAEDAAG